MILEKVTGCTCDSLTVDDVREIDINDDDRISVLKRIGMYISILDLAKFKALINNELLMYTSLDDLEYADEFYLMLIKNRTIEPLQQLDGMSAIDEEYLLIELRVSLSNYIMNVTPNDLNWILSQFVEAIGETEYLGYCDQCCDSIYKYTLEI
jgi:hypothetical protein